MNAVVKGRPGSMSQDLALGPHRIVSDIPKDEGGEGLGPSPHALLAAALASCTALTLRVYCKRKSWPLEDAEVSVSVEKGPDGAKLIRAVKIVGPLDEEQRARLLKVAEACPVHKTLSGKIEIVSKLV